MCWNGGKPRPSSGSTVSWPSEYLNHQFVPSVLWPGWIISMLLQPHMVCCVLVLWQVDHSGLNWIQSGLSEANLHFCLFFSECQDFINNTILHILLWTHEVVSFCIAFDTLKRLPGVMLDDLI